MRRIVIFVATLAILLMSVVPAFALGNGTGEVWYSPIPIDTVTSNLDGGPYEWPFNVTNYATDHTAYFELGATSKDGFATAYGFSRNRAGALLGRLTMAGEKFTFKLHDAVIYPQRAQGYTISFGDDVIQSVQISGEYRLIARNSDDELGIQGRYFTSTITNFVNANYIDIGALVYDCLEERQGFNETRMHIAELTVVVTLKKMSQATTTMDIYCPYASLVKTRYDSSYYYLAQLDDFDTKPTTTTNGDFSLRVFLTETIGSFFNMEIAPGFSFGNIFFFVAIVGLLLWFIKLIS